MNKFTPSLTGILAGISVFLLLFVMFQGVQAQTEQSTPGTAASASLPGCDPARTVQVSGTAVINVTPDEVLVQLGVQSNGTTTGGVEKANSAAIQTIIAALKGQGVEAKDISTDIYVITPVYENYDSLYIKGYRINNSIAITLHDVTRTSATIAAALDAGANQVLNVEFYTSQLRQYRDQARAMAMTAAGEKGQALADAANAQVGCVLSINENSSSYYNGWWYGSSQNLWAQNVTQNMTSSVYPQEDSPISLGHISIRAEVQMTYGLK